MGVTAYCVWRPVQQLGQRIDGQQFGLRRGAYFYFGSHLAETPIESRAMRSPVIESAEACPFHSFRSALMGWTRRGCAPC